MERLYSLAFHDLKVSGGTATIATIEYLMERFSVPLTVHLVFDKPLDCEPLLAEFLVQHIWPGRLEVVFHGLSHTCSHNVSKTWVFYHKYQAEYLDDKDNLRNATADMFKHVVSSLGLNVGICPPCWIAVKNNFDFFDTLEPIYVERILHLKFGWKKVFSPVISLGSPNKKELFFLRAFANIVHGLSILLKIRRIRVAMHVCDLENEASMQFFIFKANALSKQGFRPTLLKEFC